MVQNSDYSTQLLAIGGTTHRFLTLIIGKVLPAPTVREELRRASIDWGSSVT